jgi:hypothetical protein
MNGCNGSNPSLDRWGLVGMADLNARCSGGRMRMVEGAATKRAVGVLS